MSPFDIVVIGTSAGGLAALQIILSNINKDFKAPIVIVQHLSPDSRDSILNLLRKYSVIELTEPIDKEKIQENHIYLAPPDYHLMVESDRTFSLSLDPKVNYCRPSIDVLFETAAEVFFDKTLGIILTGANKDGTCGCEAIKKFSGIIIAQDFNEAATPTMPKSVIDAGFADYILTLHEICVKLNKV